MSTPCPTSPTWATVPYERNICLTWRHGGGSTATRGSWCVRQFGRPDPCYHPRPSGLPASHVPRLDPIRRRGSVPRKESTGARRGRGVRADAPGRRNATPRTSRRSPKASFRGPSPRQSDVREAHVSANNKVGQVVGDDGVVVDGENRGCWGVPATCRPGFTHSPGDCVAAATTTRPLTPRCTPLCVSTPCSWSVPLMRHIGHASRSERAHEINIQEESQFNSLSCSGT